MSCVKLFIAVRRPFLKCLVTMEDICDLQKSDKRLLRQTMLAREEYA